MRILSKTLCAAALLGALAPPAAAGQFTLELPGDFIGMAAVSGERGQRLAAFDADKSRPKRNRHLNWVEKRPSQTASGDPTYHLNGRERVPAGAATYDVCRLDPARPDETIVYLDAEGVVTADGGKRLAKAQTVLAHARDDALPRTRICFDLFAGEAPALVVPRLDGVELWRAKAPGAYEKHQTLPVDADIRFFVRPLGRGEPRPLQRLSMRLEMPDVTLVDYDGDQKADLCLCRDDHLSCFTQGEAGFSAKPALRQFFNLLTDDEEKDQSQRVECRLVELDGDGRVDLILQKTQFNLSDMRTALHVFLQQKTGGFPAKASQVIERSGYFAFQEVFDVDGNGRPDIVAPVTSLSWTDIVSIYLARAADIDFVYYKNEGGRFDPKPVTLHSLRFPIDLKNYSAILGVLPVWNARFRDLPATSRQILFFPERKAVELYELEPGKRLGRAPRWRLEAELGTEVERADFDKDGFHELAFAYPRDPKRSRRLLFVEARQ